MHFSDILEKIKSVFQNELLPAVESAAAKFSYKGLSGGEAVISSLLDFAMEECQKRNLSALPLDVLKELISIFVKPGSILDVLQPSLLAEVQALFNTHPALKAPSIS